MQAGHWTTKSYIVIIITIVLNGLVYETIIFHILYGHLNVICVNEILLLWFYCELIRISY